MDKIKKFKNESGQALVEFALILPILLILLGPAIDIGRAVQTKTLLQNMSGEVLHLVTLENEYAFQGTIKALQEHTANLDGAYIGEDGYLWRRTIKDYTNKSILDYDKLEQKVEMGPIYSTDHIGHHIKNSKDRKKDYEDFTKAWEEYHKGDKSGPVPTQDTGEIIKYENKTYYRDIKVTMAYKYIPITFAGKKLFKDGFKFSESLEGVIYMGGDGRDVKEPNWKGFY